ncbi:MAG: ribose-phosphate pyrophosphokinase-like domain-containing protein, partial [Lentisphaerae bacterium]|nr:ribose-phosphate pyrophosphokinase-like domain-containing protein [Lentisphaerota bacterium]
MELFMELKLFSGSTHPQLAKAIAAELGIPLGAVELGHFPGGETFVKCTEQIRDADVFIVQPTCCPPNESIMELLIMLDAARRASCGRITAV